MLEVTFLHVPKTTSCNCSFKAAKYYSRQVTIFKNAMTSNWKKCKIIRILDLLKLTYEITNENKPFHTTRVDDDEI